MTPKTPPTDRPLTAGDVPLLREGDVLTNCVGRQVIYSRPEDRLNPESALMFSDGSINWPSSCRFVSRPATSAASEGEGDKLPDGAISGTDDGQTVWLESSTGGAHKLGVWGGLSLRFEEADGTHTIRDYVDAALASLPVSELVEPGDPRHPCPICSGRSAATHMVPCRPAPPVSERERELEGLVREFLRMSVGIYGHPKDEDYGLGLIHSRARSLTAQPAGEGK